MVLRQPVAACGLQQWPIAHYDATTGTPHAYSIAYYHLCIHKRSSCVHLVSLPYIGLNGMCCSPCCNRRFWDAAVCPSSMLASAAAQSGWMVLCSCIEVNFAVTILRVARRCRAAQLLNDNLQMQKNCTGHDLVAAV